MKSTAPVLLAALLLGACALMDTGEVEYRRADPPPAEFGQRITGSLGDFCALHGGREEARDPIRRGVTDLGATYDRRACIPLFPARLIRRNASIAAPIQPNETYSIRLEHGLIAHLIEDAFSFRRLLNGRRVDRKVGEVAVLAHAFEFPATAPAENPASARFANLTSLEGVKVVYFDPDVEEGQALNFSNIPLQESRKYGGRPIAIQIIVLELDRMSGPMKSLMQTLASLGRQSGAIPGGAASEALLDLGTSLVSQDNDDVIFAYQFVLDRAAPNEHSTGAPPFEEGRYVLRRTHERRRMAQWDDLILDHNTGQLMRRANPADGTNWENARYIPFEEDTYFTINIIRQEDSSQFAYDPQSLEELNTDIQEALNSRDEQVGVVAQRLAGRLVEARNRRWAEELSSKWQTAAVRYRHYARHFADPAVTAGRCLPRQNPDVTRRRQEALFDARMGATEFLIHYSRAVAAAQPSGNTNSNQTTTGTSPASVSPLSDDDQRPILAQMAPFFLPFAEGEAELQASHLANPPSFRSTFLDHPEKFHTAAQRAAERNWSPRTCEELVSARLADVLQTAPAEAAPAPGSGASPSTGQPQ